MAFTPNALDRLARVRLLDVYREVLTARQREALRLHLEEDWSLSELALALGTSRAAAHDLVRRGLDRMRSLEEQVGACRRLEAADFELARLRGRVERLERLLAAGRPEEVSA
ncbi:MAG TPA: sigma factor-like helix-turn-helix DNA-binding protein [Candidatus Dormibacteraeota bacterium]|nr:sigma factor-like helix-turn-helix DNA-binding protein [Candidatus Dormibacteraeota bacterium]